MSAPWTLRAHFEPLLDLVQQSAINAGGALLPVLDPATAEAVMRGTWQSVGEPTWWADHVRCSLMLLELLEDAGTLALLH